MKQPNIILLMTDQLRADALGYAGHPDVKTPYLDTLASRGVNFDRAYSACPSCIAARAALHTGMEQSHHGRVGYEDNVPWRYPHTMAGELSKAGYYTQCVGKMHVHPLRNYLGFHHVVDPDIQIPAPRLDDRVPCGRSVMGERPAEERRRDFDLVEYGLSDQEIRQETLRCLNCDHFGCGILHENGRTAW